MKYPASPPLPPPRGFVATVLDTSISPFTNAPPLDISPLLFYYYIYIVRRNTKKLTVDRFVSFHHFYPGSMTTVQRLLPPKKSVASREFPQHCARWLWNGGGSFYFYSSSPQPGCVIRQKTALGTWVFFFPLLPQVTNGVKVWAFVLCEAAQNASDSQEELSPVSEKN